MNPTYIEHTVMPPGSLRLSALGTQALAVAARIHARRTFDRPVRNHRDA
jgi:hypothetical protein